MGVPAIPAGLWFIATLENTPVTPAVYHGTFEYSESISGSALNGKQGSGVILDGFDLPSTPESDGWTQLFGLYAGKLKPIGPPIFSAEMVGITTDPQLNNADILKFSLRTGNFNLIYPVMINWTSGTLQPARVCLRGSGIHQIERCSYEVKLDPGDVVEQTFVRLYNETEENGDAKTRGRPAGKPD